MTGRHAESCNKTAESKRTASSCAVARRFARRLTISRSCGSDSESRSLKLLSARCRKPCMSSRLMLPRLMLASECLGFERPLSRFSPPAELTGQGYDLVCAGARCLRDTFARRCAGCYFSTLVHVEQHRDQMQMHRLHTHAHRSLRMQVAASAPRSAASSALCSTSWLTAAAPLLKLPLSSAPPLATLARADTDGTAFATACSVAICALMSAKPPRICATRVSTMGMGVLASSRSLRATACCSLMSSFFFCKHKHASELCVQKQLLQTPVGGAGVYADRNV